MSPRVFLSQISPIAWEHPSEKTAYKSVRRRGQHWGNRPRPAQAEARIRRLMLDDAIRVGPAQRPHLYDLYLDVLQTLDWPGNGNPAPELYVAAQRFRRSGAVGGSRPFIVLSSRTIDVLEREEQRFLVARAVAQVMSDRLRGQELPGLFDCAGETQFGIFSMFDSGRDIMKWGKRSELSDDRGALLATQDVETALMTLLKLAGGVPRDDSLSVDAWLEQIAETDAAATAPAADAETPEAESEGVHPANGTTLTDNMRAGRLARRARELQQWAFSAEYAAILGGEYVRRGQEPVEEAADSAPGNSDGPTWFADGVTSEARDAVSAVSDAIEKAAEAVGVAVNRAADALGDAFNTSGEGLGDLANRASSAFRDAFKAAQSAAKAAEEHMDDAWRNNAGTTSSPVTADYESPANDATSGGGDPTDPSSGPSAAPV